MDSIKAVVFAIAAGLIYATALAALPKKQVQGAIYKFLADSKRYLEI